MATERPRIVRLLAAVPAVILMAVPTHARASTAWWEPLAFADERVTGVAVSAGGLLFVTTPAGLFSSGDGGASFQLRGPAGHVALVNPSDGPTQWQVFRGTVLTAPAGVPPVPDPRSPFLGDSAHLIAAPAAVPGVAVAVGSDNHVWRRDASGHWATSFILLPAGGLAGIPRVTSIAAFTRPLSAAVYLGTEGYGVLISQDGGDDWIRADPGLPANVLGLAPDPSTRALYAATDRGLFVHHLQVLPRPTTYTDAQLLQKWLGIGLVALVATTVAVVGLRRLVPDG
jgi:hypothetical protein